MKSWGTGMPSRLHKAFRNKMHIYSNGVLGANGSVYIHAQKKLYLLYDRILTYYRDVLIGGARALSVTKGMNAIS